MVSLGLYDVYLLRLPGMSLMHRGCLEEGLSVRVGLQYVLECYAERQRSWIDWLPTPSLRLGRQALALDEKQHTILSNRAACFLKLGRYTQAKQDAEACIELQPSFSKGHFRLALAMQVSLLT